MYHPPPAMSSRMLRVPSVVSDAAAEAVSAPVEI